MNSPQDLLDYCIAEVDHVDTGAIFLIRDLFKGYAWVKIPLANRLTLGTLFLNYAKYSDKVKPIDKGKQGQQRYEKI